jgi:hypothetical protein
LIGVVIPAKAGIHFDFDLRAMLQPAKIKMDPSFRWDDVMMFVTRQEHHADWRRSYEAGLAIPLV